MPSSIWCYHLPAGPLCAPERSHSRRSDTVKNVSQCRIVIASPSDVTTERELADQVIREAGDTVAPQLSLALRCFRWEIDTFPSFHAHGPQGAVDSLMDITTCDILVVIFWSRLGTPGPDGLSGTEHEFRLALESWS